MVNLEALLQLAHVEDIGSRSLTRLINHFGSPEKVLAASKTELETVEGISPRRAAAIQRGANRQVVEQQVNFISRYGVKVVTLWDDDFSPKLREVDFDPTPILYVRGNAELLNTKALSIVGTRSFTPYGETVVREIVEGLAGSGFTIVSGLASGIDGLAHAAALEFGLPTLAVFGCGVERIYPPSNAELGRKILENNGAFVSEFPFGTEPNRGNFPRRNRIIAGLSLGTLVVEAGEKSGALITALIAADLGREVMAIPGSVHNPKSRGCHAVIQKGAALIENAEQVLQLLKVGATPKPAAPDQAELLEPDLPEDEKRIWNLLTFGDGLHVDSIADTLNFSVAEVLGSLLMMELKGIVRQLPGKYFVRI
jgi:DNA processing protein